MNNYVLLLFSAALINHLALHDPLRSRHAFGPGYALAIALGVGGGYLLEKWLLLPWRLHDLQLFALLAWLALVAWGVPRALTRLGPAWAISAGQLLPASLLALGLILQLDQGHEGWLPTLGWSVLGGAGFWLAVLLFDDLRQRIQHSDVPAGLQGLPIELLALGIMAMAFCGLNGLLTP